MKCSWCQQTFTRELWLWEILWPLGIPASEKCPDCRSKLQPVDFANCCETCCNESRNCRDCRYWRQRYPNFLLQHQALMTYNQGMQEWLHQYKLMGDYRLRSAFVPEIKQAFKKLAYDLVIPIPLSQERYQQRGFNQVEEVLQAAGIAYRSLLRKKIHLPPQAGMNRSDRLAVPQPFVIEKDQEAIKSKRVLLVDDVYTTGQTLYHAAEALLTCQPKTITSFSFAR